MEEKKKKEKEKFRPVWQNIRYVYQGVFRKYPKTRIQLPAYILLQVAKPMVGTAIPAVAIAAITEGNAAKYVAAMAAVLTAYVLVSRVAGELEMRLLLAQCYTRLSFYMRGLLEKIITTNYAQVEPSDRHPGIGKAAFAVSSNYRGVEGLMEAVPKLLVQVFGLLTYGTAVLALDIRILAIMVVMFILDVLLRNHAIHYGDSKREEISEVYRQFSYLHRGTVNLASGKDIRIYRMQQWFQKKGEALLKRSIAHSKSTGLRWYFPTLSDQACIFARDILAYFVLMTMVAEGSISIAVFTMYLGIVSGFSEWMYSMSLCINNLRVRSHAVDDFRAVMEERDETANEEGDVPEKSDTYEICFEDVSFSYEGAEEEILSHLSFTIRPGEKLALVGNNGAGKTTIVKLLCGLYQPTGGRILLNGTDIRTFQRERYQELIGVLFQDVNPLSFTIAANISGREEAGLDRERLVRSLKEAGLWERVESLPHGIFTHITQQLDDNGISLSGGETQKLLLARAVYKDAPILILDEPTSALDPVSESRMYAEYNAMAKEKTSLFISHRLASTRFCDRILFLEKGRAVETGTHDELMEKGGKYREIFDIQSHYYKETEVDGHEKKTDGVREI